MINNETFETKECVAERSGKQYKDKQRTICFRSNCSTLFEN